MMGEMVAVIKYLKGYVEDRLDMFFLFVFFFYDSKGNESIIGGSYQVID